MIEDYDLDSLLAGTPTFNVASLIERADTELEAAMRAYETALPRGYLSQSQIGTFLKCGRAYEFRYVLGAATRGNTKMAQGSAVHVAADALHKSMIEARDISEAEMRDRYSDAHEKAFDPAFELIVAEEDEDLGAVKDRGYELVSVYRRAALGGYVPDVPKGQPPLPAYPRLQVVASERVIMAPLVLRDAAGEPVHEPVPLMAILDIEEESRVRDIKVRSKLPNAGEADNSLQLALYSVAANKPDVSIDALVKPSAKLGVRMKHLHAHMTPAAQHHAISVATEVADDIRLGRFRRTAPDNWWCSESWCGYWGNCRGAGR